MQAIQVGQLVQSEQELRVSRVARPELDADSVEVRVRAAAANFFDLLMAKGQYQHQPPLPFVLGAEFAGEVTRVGARVEGVAVGDRVFGGMQTGAYAEFAVVPPEALRPLPDSMSFEEGCGIFVTWPTSYAALVNRAQLRSGETCLVHAGAGGVGIAAVQIAKALGARVIATAGSDEKCEVARRAGADLAINYKTEDWIEAVKEATDGEGCDVIYDPVGLATESTKVIAWNGRLLIIGFAAGSIPKLAVNRLLLKNCAAVGLHWGAYTLNEPEAVAPVWDALFELYRRGQLSPVLYPRIFALEEVPEMLGVLQSRGTYGKVVVVPVGGSRL